MAGASRNLLVARVVLTIRALRSVELTLSAAEWIEDEDGLLRCPDCCEPRERNRDEDDGRAYSDPRDEREERRR